MENDFCFPWENLNILKDLDLNKPLDASKSLRYLFKFWPSTNKLINFHIPQFISVYPAIDCKFPLIDNKDLREAKCSNCGAYLDYLAKVNKVERKWICPFCSTPNQIDDDEFAHFFSRGELHNSYYEMKVQPNDSNGNINLSKNLLFIIDVSFPAVQSGMTDEFIKQIRNVVTTTSPNYNISILTMSDKITIYNLLTKEKIEITDFYDQELPYQAIFQPIMSCMQNVDDILNEIGEYVPEDSINGHCILNAIIQAGNIIGQNGGMILVGFSGLSMFGPLSRNGPYEFDIEQSAQLTKDDPLTKKSIEIGLLFRKMNISVHLFAGGTEFCDLMVVGHIASATSGRVYCYGKLNEISKRSLQNDILTTVKQSYFCDCSLNINVSEGLQFAQKDNPITLLVPFKKDVRIPILRSNDFLRIELQNTTNVSHCYIQLSMIYTKFPDANADSNSNNTENENENNDNENDAENNENNENENINHRNNDAQRIPQKILRVITHVIPVTDDRDKIFQSIDEAYLIKMITVFMLTNVMQIGTNNAEIVVMNELLSLYPQFPKSIFHLTHSLLSNSIFKKGSKSDIDRKSSEFINIFFFDELTILLYLYPRLLLIEPTSKLSSTKKSLFSSIIQKFSLFKDNHNYDNDDNEEDLINNINIDTMTVVEKKNENRKSMYVTLPLSRKSLNDGFVFMIHKHDAVFLFVKKVTPPLYLMNAFGVKNFRDVGTKLPILRTKENKLIWNAYNECCMLSKMILPLEIITEGNRNEVMNDLFVDDKLVSFASLSSWITQFYYQASLFTCI